MSLSSAVSKLFIKAKSLFVAPNDETTSSALTFGSTKNGFWSNALWFCDREREAVWDDISNMDANDGITSQALDTIAEVAIGLEEGFTDKFSIVCPDPEARKVINDCVFRLKLRRDAKDIIRKMAKQGNEFREIVIGQDASGQSKIMRLRADIPAYTIYPNIKDGNQDDLEPWIQKNDKFFWGKSVKFKYWQLVHWAYGERNMCVSTPFLSSARRNFKLLQNQEDTMGLARMTRAYMKMVHKIPVPFRSDAQHQQECIQKYRDTIEKKEFYNWAQGKTSSLNNPIQVDTDIYLPEDGTKRGSIEVIDPKNDNLQQIDDVIYAQSKHISRLGVPREYLNIEGAKSSSLNQGSGAGKGDKHFARKIRDVQSAFIDGLTFIFNLELMLHGIEPLTEDSTLIYQVRMTKVNSDDAYSKAQAENTNADALNKYLKVLEIPEELVVDKFLNLNDNQRQLYADKIKLRNKPNPALQTGGAAGPGAPGGQRPASSIKASTKDPQSD